ncbi:hypothetical protein H8B06_05375 [Sphingobacterium sp. DN00404]|uniref:Uncharacterized protein n=1 Tax=Sphingobacterium micropteri TaxID=2763501 RepID=A0ABR7YLQ2_9SPHI|nr:hypothetical protein [Sphingobacterium micropteri]MBD1432249.1 hypothetical protein [Sphingobacterium micropteri]
MLRCILSSTDAFISTKHLFKTLPYVSVSIPYRYGFKATEQTPSLDVVSPMSLHFGKKTIAIKLTTIVFDIITTITESSAPRNRFPLILHKLQAIVDDLLTVDQQKESLPFVTVTTLFKPGTFYYLLNNLANPFFSCRP